MPDLFATPGAANANAFVTLDEFQAYLDARLNAASLLTSVVEDDQVRAILEATRDITLVPYIGTRVTTTQALSWPRNYAINPDLPNPSYLTDISLLYFTNTVIPSRVKNAVCEYAMAFLKAGTTDVAALDPALNIKSKRVDVLDTVYIDAQDRPQGLARYPRVVAMLAPLIDPAQTGGLRLARG